MKTFVFSLLLLFVCSTGVFAQDCANGQCKLQNRPVVNAVANVSDKVVDTTKAVVVGTASVVRDVVQVPVSVVKSVAQVPVQAVQNYQAKNSNSGCGCNQTRGYKLFSRLGNRCR